MNADLPRFVALEGRVWVVLASGLLTAEDVPQDFPFHDLIRDKPPWFCNGGSSIARPDGTWAVAPLLDEERVIVADVDAESVGRARQTFDPGGHYSRPDVFDLRVDRRRASPAQFED
jgi:nitrilase